MKKYLLILFLMTSLTGYAQLRTGLLVGGGLGFERNLSLNMNNLSIAEQNLTGTKFLNDYKFHALLGYRFRIENSKHQRWFYDIDPFVNAKAFEGVTKDYIDGEFAGSASGYDVSLSFAISSSVNYKIYKGLYGGIGLEPTFHIVSEGGMFDIPIVWKVGYNINNKIDLAVNYRLGLTNTIDSRTFEKGQVSDLNISIFIPFTVSK